MLKFKSITGGLIFVMTCISLLTTVAIGAMFLFSSTRGNAILNEKYRRHLEQNVDDKLIDETQIALSAVREIYSRQQAGIMTEEEAKTEAARLVRSLRYDNGQGYFWIDTYDGTNVVLLGNDDEGKNRLAFTDESGSSIIKDFIENGRREGGGFTDSVYPKPHETKPLPKRNYSIAFEPYKWVIGTGVWTDEIDAIIAAREREQQESIKNSLIQGFLCLIALQALFVAVAVSVGRKLSKPLIFMTKRLVALGNGNLSISDEQKEKLNKLMGRSDELGSMSRAMKEMHEKLFAYQKVILGMARNDMLTGLANRRYLQEYLENIAKDSQLTIISLDLDHFKEVNDTYGHQTGDAALLIFAEVLKSSFTEALNVRMGGDEFMVVMSKPIDLIDVKMQLQSFMDNLLAIYKTDPDLARLTVSAGIAYALDEPIPLDILMQQSDIALYDAKLSGRNCYRVYHKGMENHPGMEKREAKDPIVK